MTDQGPASIIVRELQLAQASHVTIPRGAPLFHSGRFNAAWHQLDKPIWLSSDPLRYRFWGPNQTEFEVTSNFEALVVECPSLTKVSQKLRYAGRVAEWHRDLGHALAYIGAIAMSHTPGGYQQPGAEAANELFLVSPCNQIRPRISVPTTTEIFDADANTSQ